LTKRYDAHLVISAADGGAALVRVDVTNKTLDTVQQLVRLAVSDLTKVEPTTMRRRFRSRQVDPPIDVGDGPTPEDIEALND